MPFRFVSFRFEPGQLRPNRNRDRRRRPQPPNSHHAAWAGHSGSPFSTSGATQVRSFKDADGKAQTVKTADSQYLYKPMKEDGSQIAVLLMNQVMEPPWAITSTQMQQTKSPRKRNIRPRTRWTPTRRTSPSTSAMSLACRAPPAPSAASGAAR